MEKRDFQSVDSFLANFTLEMVAMEEKDNDKVYYKLQMELKDRKVKWQIEKRFSDFEALHLDISKTTFELPYLPAKSLFKLQSDDLQKRKNDLLRYLKQLVLRPDVVQNEVFQEFLQLRKYGLVPRNVQYRMLGSISGFSMKVRDVHYEESQGIVFILTGDNDLKTKVGGFLSNLLGSQKKGDPCGKLLCLRAKNQYTFDFSKLWSIDFYSHPQIMTFDPKLTMLAVGLYNGDIEIYRVMVEKNYQNYESYCVIKRHTAAITGIYFDHTTATVYSTSRDKSFLITNISSNESHYRVDEKILSNPITALCVDTANERVFLGDSTGTIFVYSTTEPIQIITTVYPESESAITCIYMTKQKNYILFGFHSGLIRVFELKKKGSDRVVNPVSAITAADGLNSLSFSLKDKEIYTNCQWNILVINSAQNIPTVSINSHKDAITKIQYVEDRQIFVTGSKDFTVKFWKLRGSKDDKESEFEQLYHATNSNRVNQQQVAELQAELRKGMPSEREEQQRRENEEKEKKRLLQEQKEKERLEQAQREKELKKQQEREAQEAAAAAAAAAQRSNNSQVQSKMNKKQVSSDSESSGDDDDDDDNRIFGWDQR